MEGNNEVKQQQPAQPASRRKYDRRRRNLVRNRIRELFNARFDYDQIAEMMRHEGFKNPDGSPIDSEQVGRQARGAGIGVRKTPRVALGTLPPLSQVDVTAAVRAQALSRAVRDQLPLIQPTVPKVPTIIMSDFTKEETDLLLRLVVNSDIPNDQKLGLIKKLATA